MRESENTGCARRKPWRSIFGQGFDSPHLHQKRARRTLRRSSIWLAACSFWFAGYKNEKRLTCRGKMPRTSASLFICLRCLLLQLVNCLLHIFGALSPAAPAAPAAAGPSLDARCALCLAFLLSCCSCRERYSFYSPSEKQPGRTPHELFCGRRRVCLALCAKIAEYGCCEKQDDAYIFSNGSECFVENIFMRKSMVAL